MKNHQEGMDGYDGLVWVGKNKEKNRTKESHTKKEKHNK